MKDSEIWLILVNGLASSIVASTKGELAEMADAMLDEYKKRFDTEASEGCE
jgi:hypothetical protein